MNWMNWMFVAGIGIGVSGFLFGWALVLITRKPVPIPEMDASRKYYDKLMTQEEIDYFNQARWD